MEHFDMLIGQGVHVFKEKINSNANAENEKFYILLTVRHIMILGK